MKKIITVISAAAILLLSGCSNISKLLESGSISINTEGLKEIQSAVDEIQSVVFDEAENSGSAEDASASKETEDDAEAEEGMAWPDVIPDVIPEMTNVVIEGYWPQNAGEKEYVVNLNISSEEKQIIIDYIDSLTSLGFVQEYQNENDFGLDYFSSNGEYDVFINAVFDSLSKISITKK